MLAAIPHKMLDLPELDELATGARSEFVQHTLYKGMILPLIALTGLSVITWRNTRKAQSKHKGDDKHGDA